MSLLRQYRTLSATLVRGRTWIRGDRWQAEPRADTIEDRLHDLDGLTAPRSRSWMQLTKAICGPIIMIKEARTTSSAALENDTFKEKSAPPTSGYTSTNKTSRERALYDNGQRGQHTRCETVSSDLGAEEYQ
ncbi:hypothetical protein LTR56_018266 [Elasticomyces elasticus]|nr:hypothetical protein LTR56_018266 [Elasticomyces elasticus]KAK3636756.1 hypothetical protein LTR22_018571 [Elasticomyces elasticus]KAK4912380.1 hypothetical protein LTR49_019198 [Elasticomyces elasticus]KAK5751825.1 hypothetical protein LTS12_018066 [Elasticomyces elasticus]